MRERAITGRIKWLLRLSSVVYQRVVERVSFCGALVTVHCRVV